MSELTKWELRYFELAKHVSQWSKDPTAKVGAVLVGATNKDIAIGYNGFPPGLIDSDDRLLDRRVKNILTQHAERNVLDNAHFDTKGNLLVITRMLCSNCALSAISKGVNRVICPEVRKESSWADDAEWSKIILLEAGIELIELTGCP